VSKRPYRVTTNTTTIETHSIIVATGAESKWLDVPGEYELRGGGVSSCATCDGFLFKDQDVVVVGGGDTAMEDALVLARTSKSVTVIHRRDEFRASHILSQRVLQHPDISVIWNSTVKEIVGKVVSNELNDNNGDDDEEQEEDNLDDIGTKKVVQKVLVSNVNTNAVTSIDCNAVFVAIGHVPNSGIFNGQVEFDESHSGYLKVVDGTPRTSVPGVFAAGDISDAIYRQAITSAGSGAAAALEAERWLAVEGLGNEKAEFEAELLRDLIGDEGTGGSGEEYNVYSDNANAGKGKQEL